MRKIENRTIDESGRKVEGGGDEFVDFFFVVPLAGGRAEEEKENEEEEKERKRGEGKSYYGEAESSMLVQSNKLAGITRLANRC